MLSSLYVVADGEPVCNTSLTSDDATQCQMQEQSLDRRGGGNCGKVWEMAGASGAACGAPSVSSAKPLPRARRFPHRQGRSHTSRTRLATIAFIPHLWLASQAMRRGGLTCLSARLPLGIVSGRPSEQRMRRIGWRPRAGGTHPSAPRLKSGTKSALGEADNLELQDPLSVL
jgi:hypothetical protein